MDLVADLVVTVAVGFEVMRGLLARCEDLVVCRFAVMDVERGSVVDVAEDVEVVEVVEVVQVLSCEPAVVESVVEEDGLGDPPAVDPSVVDVVEDDVVEVAVVEVAVVEVVDVDVVEVEGQGTVVVVDDGAVVDVDVDDEVEVDSGTVVEVEPVVEVDGLAVEEVAVVEAAAGPPNHKATTVASAATDTKLSRSLLGPLPDGARLSRSRLLIPTPSRRPRRAVPVADRSTARPPDRLRWCLHARSGSRPCPGSWQVFREGQLPAPARDPLGSLAA